MFDILVSRQTATAGMRWEQMDNGKDILQSSVCKIGVIDSPICPLCFREEGYQTIYSKIWDLLAPGNNPFKEGTMSKQKDIS